ncbi:hypothetical protein [Psychrobium sp. 1_MG-2023]|uniref:hypothetical protein n=1 Tax=Psychrobium sp. 1_MG-2023 TaxID=3062624 RepID=UPI0027346739|nr:hypothetical protein [Psychrobium sp. 1_MG-2023]MDP2562950.1 hypothetical protein [Psychrobium sp. 1_MG-2023]
MNYLRDGFAIIIGFIIILKGSVVLPGTLLPMLFGPYPFDGNVPFSRVFTDFSLSFIVTVFGAYLAVVISASKKVWIGLVSGVAYFCLSAYWYSGYGLVGAEWISPAFMLIKVPVAAFIGGFVYQKYNKSLKQDK